jgi:hypothetical protein
MKTIYVTTEKVSLLEDLPGAMYPARVETPEETLAGCAKAWEDNEILKTVSEEVILWITCQVSKTTDEEETPEVEIDVDDFQIVYIGAPFEDNPDICQSLNEAVRGMSPEPQVLRVDESGEFIDEWPKGFFEHTWELLRL